jgi:hypothetical protein
MTMKRRAHAERCIGYLLRFRNNENRTKKLPSPSNAQVEGSGTA